ncbi:hypothetical protein KY348_04230 [Candidatus Woesearchaeota archaeon]|nr:hypothetical protein [Candidatus Woesearchaeota archaeon]
MLLTYLVLIIIVFLGLFIGLLIGYSVQEELKPGLKYFNILRHLLFIAILIVFFVKNPSIPFILLIALLIIAFSFSRYRETLYYYALAVIFFLSWLYNGFTLLAPLIFLYGFPVGSIYLYHHIKEKNKKKKIILGLLKQYAGFLIVGVILGLIGLVL